MRPRTFFLLLLIASIIFLFGCIFLHYKYKTDADSIISIVGSIASLGGIVFATWQIRSLKSQTDAVSKALVAAREDMANLTIFAEINKHSQYVNEIEQYTREGKFSEALITYKDLKEKLTILLGYIKNKDDYAEEYEALKHLVDSAGSDIKSINSIVINPNSLLNSLDKEVVIDNLEKIKTFLDNTSGTIKGRKI